MIEGLEAGADDYLIKPVRARELLARCAPIWSSTELGARVTGSSSASGCRTRLERLAEMGSWEIDLSTGVMRGSEQLLRMLSLTADELAALPFVEAIERRVLPGDADRARRALEAAIAERRPFSSEVRLMRDDGEQAVVSVRGEVVCDDRGEPTLRAGSSRTSPVAAKPSRRSRPPPRPGRRPSASTRSPTRSSAVCSRPSGTNPSTSRWRPITRRASKGPASAATGTTRSRSGRTDGFGDR